MGKNKKNRKKNKMTAIAKRRREIALKAWATRRRNANRRIATRTR